MKRATLGKTKRRELQRMRASWPLLNHMQRRAMMLLLRAYAEGNRRVALMKGGA